MALKLTPGEQVARGRYILRRYVSRGAHAELWEAEQTGSEGFRRQVALKIVGNREGLSDPARDSLLREGRLAARLNHPNIIQLYDVGQEERFVYIAMEFIHGADLRQCLRAHLEQHQKAMPWPIVARIGSLIARGLEHAHNQADEDGTPLRIVHRDVKPSNVLFSHNGLIKLIDFGIAKSLTLSNNRSVEFKGTVAYVSPEQIRSEELDHRSDLFSFGVLLYELLSGKRPFDVADGGFGAAMIATLERQPPRLITLLPDLPPEMDQLLFSMISKERHLRPNTDREVYSTFETLLRQHKIVLEQEHLAAFYDDLLGEDDATVYNVRTSAPSAPSLLSTSSQPSQPTASSRPSAFSAPIALPQPVWSSSDTSWEGDDEDSDTIPVSAATDIHSYLKQKLQTPASQTHPMQDDEDDEATSYEPLSAPENRSPSAPENRLPFSSQPTWQPNNPTLRAQGTPQHAVPVALGKRQRTLADDPRPYAEDLAINTPTSHIEPRSLLPSPPHARPFPMLAPLPPSLPPLQHPSTPPLQPLPQHPSPLQSPSQHPSTPPLQSLPQHPSPLQPYPSTPPPPQVTPSAPSKIWPYLAGGLILVMAFLLSFFFFRR